MLSRQRRHRPELGSPRVEPENGDAFTSLRGLTRSRGPKHTPSSWPEWLDTLRARDSVETTGEQWYRRAIDSGIAPLVKFAKALKKRLHGILAHCRWRLHTSVIEGINNKIKVTQANGLWTPRLAATQPARPILAYPRNSLYEKPLTLTAPADRPVRAPAHAVAFTTAAAIRGAGSVHRRTPHADACALPRDSGRAGSPPATDCRQTHRRRCRSFTLAASPTTAPRGSARQMSRFQVWPSACLLAARYPAGTGPVQRFTPALASGGA